jgi:hypothetical protein
MAAGPMVNLQAVRLTGYNAFTGGGRTDIVQAIWNEHPLDLTLPDSVLADAVFGQNFMPYARRNWVYEGGMSNCQHLADAFIDTWYYIKRANPKVALPAMTVCCVAGPLVSRPLPVFDGRTRGNIRAMGTGEFDGRCYFALHHMCALLNKYYDPTYGRTELFSDYFLETLVDPIGEMLRRTPDKSRIFARSSASVTGFSDSWLEMNGLGWISAAEWKSRTSQDRTWHFRSGDLLRLDKALAGFEAHGADALIELRDAFRIWYNRNPKETSTRNKGGCVEGLRTFLAGDTHREESQNWD